MRNLLWEPPTDKELAVWKGLRKREHFPEPHETVWDENWDIVMWFRTMFSQFEHNGYGYTRLDYNVVYREWDDMGIDGQQRVEWKRKLRVLEDCTLYERNPKGA